MSEFSKLKPIAKAYVTSVVVVGTMVLAASALSLYEDPLGSRWFVLAILTLLTGSFTVKVPSTNASLSVSETFVFASVLLFGPAAGTITVLLECLIILFWMNPQGKPLHRVLFNLAAPAVSIWISGTIFFLVAPFQPASQVSFTLQSLFLPLGIFTALYFLLNSWLVAVAVGFETGQRAREIWWTNFTWLSVNYFSGASVAALLVTYIKDLDLSALAIIIPLLVVSYLTFRTAMGRVEDSNNHLSELNRLYLSTIETLAMAIDAKDQITHGHIRRVQAHTVGLAKHVGIVDPTLIKAIEAAALLHDMGKLAVPEYILNKPGKLTDAEFAKMKLHATIGADILTAIEFPYPVVPIVRHHHENWDGTGYPAGLKGTDIPIGARILSVVDCFDALTSDRPYRPRLSDEEAMKILFERRGSMYDPLIVDTFSRVHRDIAPSQSSSITLPEHVLEDITTASRSSRTLGQASLDEIASSAEEVAAMFALGRALAGLCDIKETGDLLAKHLRRLIPFVQSILFVYDVRTDELEAKHAFGDLTSAVKGMRIALGERLSGWVAANRQVILNSDPSLDLGDIARTAQPRLKSCISSPVLCGDQLVGVLSLYAEGVDYFSSDHRRVIETVSALIGKAVKQAALEQATPQHDLPSLSQFEEFLKSTGSDRLRSGSSLTVLLVEFVAVGDSMPVVTDAVRESVFSECAKSIRSLVANEDVLLRSDSGGIVIVLSNPEKHRSARLIQQLQDRLGKQTVRLDSGLAVAIRPVLSCASSPSNGASFRELISAAQLQQSEPSVSIGSVH